MQVDQVNFLAIELLELLGNKCPNQGQIDLVESLIITLLGIPTYMRYNVIPKNLQSPKL